MRKILAMILTVAGVIAIPSGCSQPKGLTSQTRISPNTHIASGRMLEAQRNFGGAEDQYRQAIEAQPDLTIAHHRLAELYLKLGRFDDARRTLRSAIEAGADEASLRNNLGFTLLRLEQYDEAEQMFEAALAISPEFHRARMNLALLHARAGRIDDSINEFEKLLPRADALYNVAVIRMQQRDYLTAAWGFGEAASLNPNLPEARSNFEKARFLAQHSPQRQPNDDFLAALNIPPQSREPEVVHTASVQPVQTTPTIAERAPVTTQPKAVRRAAPRPVRPVIAEAAQRPRPIETKTVEPTPSVSLMRDISSSVRRAAIAAVPQMLQNTRPSTILTDSQCDETTDSPNSQVPEPTTHDADCDTASPPPVRLTSAQPTKAVAPVPMTPVTTE